MSFESFWHGMLRQPYYLHTTAHGDPGKPTIILLHGIAASGEHWSKFIPLLTPYYYCITIDLLGFGQSPKPQWANYDKDQHIRSIRHTIKLLHINGSYTLAGHSLGSLLAANYATRFPKQIKQLLLLSPPVYPPADTIQGKLALKKTDLLMRVYHFLRSSPRMTPMNITRLGKFGIIPISIMKHPDTWIPFKRTLERCIEQQTILRDIRHISIPVELFYGRLDTVLVGPNVRQLAAFPSVHMHTFQGNHKLGQKYAEVVANILISQDTEASNIQQAP